MGILKAIGHALGITEWWLKAGRGRVRRKIIKLKVLRKKIIKSPPSLKKSRKIKLIDGKIKELKDYLMQE